MFQFSSMDALFQAKNVDTSYIILTRFTGVITFRLFLDFFVIKWSVRPRVRVFYLGFLLAELGRDKVVESCHVSVLHQMLVNTGSAVRHHWKASSFQISS